MHVIYNEYLDRFLAIPEGKSYGSEGAVKPWQVQWLDLDHAARFDNEQSATRTLVQYGCVGARVVSLEEAWRLA